MLFWDVWQLTFMDTKMKVFKSGTSTNPKEARRGVKGAVSYLLWLQSP